MAIKPIVLQRRLAEAGRIRIGQVVEGRKKNGDTYTRPEKLETLRFTSASRPLIEKIAAEYGGTVEPWTPANGGAQAWEVITPTSRVPVIVPPQDVAERQYMEQWAGGRCVRRCDGETELLTNQPCLCVAADDMRCKPKTRLIVMLRDIEGLGSWRIESNGWDAASELPNVAEFLMQNGGYVNAWLYLKPRKRVVEVNGKPQTQNWMVPALEVEGVTPGELAAGMSGRPAVGQGQQAPDAVEGGGRPAIEAPAEKTSGLADPAVREVARVAACRTLGELTACLQEAIEGYQVPNIKGLPESLQAAFAKARELLAVADEAGEGGSSMAPPADTDALWAQIVAAWPGDRIDEIEDAFAEANGGEVPATATPEALAAFLADVQAGRIKPATNDDPPF